VLAAVGGVLLAVALIVAGYKHHLHQQTMQPIDFGDGMFSVGDLFAQGKISKQALTQIRRYSL
jgi:hypothetical protein